VYRDNRPKGLRCVHPLVTLLEKLDALQRRVLSEREPSGFVRHFEDVSCLVRASGGFSPIEYASPRALAEELLAEGQLEELPSAAHAAFLPGVGPRWDAIRQSYEAISPMFWGPRVSLDEACGHARAWLAHHF
jgi:hypothetical protein